MDKQSLSPNPELQEESLLELIKRLGNDSATLVRTEMALAKQEFIEKLRGFQSGAIMVSVGAVLSVIAFITLWSSLIIWLADNYLSLASATLVTGAALAIIGGLIVFYGIRLFQQTTEGPLKTVEALQGRTGNG